MKSISITSAFVGIFAGLSGAFFKMFHMPLGNELLISSVVLSIGAVIGMVAYSRKNKEEMNHEDVELGIGA